MNRPIIIEFNGLPGSGKTTIVKALQFKLEEIGATTMFHYNRLSYHRRPRSMVFAFSYWKLMMVAFKYAHLLPKRRRFIYILSLYYLRMYRHFIEDEVADYLIVDQGIIQSFISLAHCDRLPKTDRLMHLIKMMHLEKLPLLIVNCNVSDEIANDRISSRPYMGGRVGRMSVETRRKVLVDQSDNFSYLRGVIKDVYPSIGMVDINTERSVKESVSIVLSRIVQEDI